jgi:hypothetical protein
MVTSSLFERPLRSVTVSLNVIVAGPPPLRTLVRAERSSSIIAAGPPISRVCPAGRFRQRLGDVDAARPDGIHFSDAGADWLAQWLGPQLVDAAFDAGRLTSGRVS